MKHQLKWLARLMPKAGRLLNCPLCGLPAVEKYGLCADCETKMPNKPSERSMACVEGAKAAFLYEEPALTLVHRFKYENERYLAELFARFMAGMDDFPKEAVLVPVPLHEKRRKERGFSQTAELCRELSKLTGRRVEEGILKRERDTPPQTGMTLAQRQSNLKDAFSASNAEGIAAILVDDVITTGATLGECALTLKRAGAKTVFALCACSAEKQAN